MVYADLGLMAGGFDAMEDVALPADRTAVESVRERLAKGEGHLRQSVGEATGGSAHGHYCLGVLALARGDDDKAAERHLAAAHLHFSKRVRSYGSLVPRANLYTAIAKARQLQPDKLVHAARVIGDALASGARIPVHLVRETVEAFDLADDKENLRHVSEAVIEVGNGLVLDELAGCGPALRHCPLLAEKLHSRASASGRAADLRAADLRAALRGHMHAQSHERARDALDEPVGQDVHRGPDQSVSVFRPLTPCECERIKPPVWKDMTTPAIPAKRSRFSRHQATAESDSLEQQEWQIVQPLLNLRGPLPGYGPPTLRCPSDRVTLRPVSRHSIWYRHTLL